MTDATLKPCPFCGSAEVALPAWLAGYPASQVTRVWRERQAERVGGAV